MRSKKVSGAFAAAMVMVVAWTMVSFAQSGSTESVAQASTKMGGAKPVQTGQSGTKCCSAGATQKSAAPVPKPADPNVVACHALEVHTNAQPAVTILVFNQKNKDDHERLSDLLKDNEGTSVEVRTSDGTWRKASVARLRSCFGRGLLFFSGDASPVEEKDDFVLRFPAKKTS